MSCEDKAADRVKSERKQLLRTKAQRHRRETGIMDFETAKQPLGMRDNYC